MKKYILLILAVFLFTPLASAEVFITTDGTGTYVGGLEGLSPQGGYVDGTPTIALDGTYVDGTSKKEYKDKKWQLKRKWKKLN